MRLEGVFWGCAEDGDWPECVVPVYGYMQAELEPGMGSEPQVQGRSLREAPLLVAPLPNLRPGTAACRSSVAQLDPSPFKPCRHTVGNILASLACTSYRHGPPSMWSRQNC